MRGIYLSRRPKRVVILGSGALQIGQAGEFDYSGSQAIKALREEGIATVLINPNIATIQTSADMADRVYLHAVIPELVEKIIEKERADALLLSFGGQTALNCGLALEASGALERLGVRVLGTPVATIRATEDRLLFNRELAEIDVCVANSVACENMVEVLGAGVSVGFPVIIRSGFSLGGLGSSLVRNEAELEVAAQKAFAGGVTQILVEEYLEGWKEIEYEVVRDARDNAITVCNMENFDPMGIHTGESIVVAPSQTLNDYEYQMLRSVALKTIRHLGIIGECNIQYALNPANSEYRVIEVNARLSRSSALASKATGYPLAYVAAKIALGYSLPELPNSITLSTSAFFEPALDYIVCKIPRWDLTKFKGAVTELGSEMKSVGEVMAIGRTFPEVLQKALRMLDIGVMGLDPTAFESPLPISTQLQTGTPTRVFHIARAFAEGATVDDVHELTRVDRWFLHQIKETMGLRGRLLADEFDAAIIRSCKRSGFSDAMLGELTRRDPDAIRAFRLDAGIEAHIARIDTLAGEFPAETNYLYSTYHASADEIVPTRAEKVLIIGSGVYRIGSSVEFDWCCVNAVKAAAELGFETIMLNCNPETVSTDYDVCDQLVFDEISLESILDLHDREGPLRVVVSMGGQTANNLALSLAAHGVDIVGTTPANIDRAEDRRKFSALLDELGINQPNWRHVTDLSDVDDTVAQLGGFPVLVRPSYVLSGAAMSVAHEIRELHSILDRARQVSSDHPVVVSRFETHARELEIDAVADKGKIISWAISEHVEDAGVHSGDATMIFPPQRLYIGTIRAARQIAERLAEALEINGPFNVQYLAKNNAVKVIECNLRASRSLPFVSKLMGVNFARLAVKHMLGSPVTWALPSPLDFDYVGVKVPMFSFSRLAGADPMLGVEMASTGEVGCIGRDLHEALLHGLIATGFRFPKKGVLLSLGPTEEKYLFAEEARVLVEELGLPIHATIGTAEMLKGLGIACEVASKLPQEEHDGLALIESGEVDMVINIPRSYDNLGRPDGYHLRRRSVDMGVPLITDLQLARAIIEALRNYEFGDLALEPWDHFVTQVS